MTAPRTRADRRPGARTEVRASLVAAPPEPHLERTWRADAAALVAGARSRSASGSVSPSGTAGWDPIRVTGGPGTGKSSLVVDVAVARLTDPGVDPESVLVLAADRRAVARLREQISTRVLRAGRDTDLRRSTREPLVRTVHSYAFAVLRLQASAHGNPPPRLITGSEQDAVLRELLAGDIADGARSWPERLRPALGTDGFAQALRDLMMRAAERGVGPEELIALGREHGRDEWVAAGVAYRQYEQTTLLRGAVGVEAPQASAPAVDAAELIGSALTALSTDDVLLGRERARIRHLLVDDAQHLDPHAAALIRLVGTGTVETVIAGDGDQSIFGFRGASSRFLDSLAPAPVAAAPASGVPREVVLTVNHRSVDSIVAATAAIAARLPRTRTPAAERVADDGPSAVTVTAYSSAAKEATAIADTLRRAHLFDGIAWSQMAVIVRSVPRAIAPLRRALRAAGVPVTTPATETPLHRQRAVAALLSVLRGVVEEVSAEDALALLSGPVGGADPTSLRRLRRGLRRVDEAADRSTGDGHEIAGDDGAEQRDSLDIVVDLLGRERSRAQAHLDLLTATEGAPLVRVLDALHAARTEAARGGGVEDVLWAAWQSTGAARRWSATALRGGPAADQADRDLDAVVALFDVAASFTDNLPAGTVAAFVEHVGKLQIPGEQSRRTTISDTVTIVSAHAAAGREWDVVAVAGVLDGLWPSLRSRGSILGTPQLVDLLDGVATEALDTVSRTASALAEERRLFLVACSRARRRLVVSAVDDGSGDAAPSRFVIEMAAAAIGTGVDDTADDPGSAVSADGMLEVAPAVRRVLSLPSLVATLRAQVCAPDPDPAVADLLARLADAGVPGAHPSEWFGLPEASSDVALWSPEAGPITLSPSSIEALQRCSLRWILERNGGRDGDSAPAVAGTLVHTLVQALAGEIDPTHVTEALHRVWDQVDVGARWFSAHELDRVESMLTHFAAWLRQTRGELEEVAVEVDVDAVIPPAEVPDDPDDIDAAGVRLRGRIDRLERDHAGRPVVVDVKTGKTVVSKDDAAVHPQLAAYQLALHLGGVPGVGGEPGGGRLVYVNGASTKTGATERVQPPLDPEQIEQWIGMVRSAARASVGPVFVATVNPGCVRCPLTASCPASIAGKAVTDD